MLDILVITVSDRVSRGESEDFSGPKIVEILRDSGIDADVSLTVVPDEREEIRAAILGNLDRDYILTTGGTGLSPRDITPEVTREICDREIPGISEFLRSESLKETAFAILSRGFSGMKGTTVIINFPGSVRGAEFCTRLLLPVLEHGKKMITGAGH